MNYQVGDNCIASLDVRCMNIEAQCVVMKIVPYIGKYALCDPQTTWIELI